MDNRQNNSKKQKVGKVAEKVKLREKGILALLREDNTLTRGALAEELGIGTNTVYRCIKAMKERGVLKRIGGKYKGRWKIQP
jgi:ATP-dependent DNA helicase RecG